MGVHAMFKVEDMFKVEVIGMECSGFVVLDVPEVTVLLGILAWNAQELRITVMTLCLVA